MKRIVRIICPECEADFPVMVEEITACQIVSCPDCDYEANAQTFKLLPDSYEEI